MSERRCPNPACGEEIARPAREGGLVYTGASSTRRTAGGTIVIRCKHCGEEMELVTGMDPAPPTGRLVFRRMRVGSALPE